MPVDFRRLGLGREDEAIDLAAEPDGEQAEAPRIARRYQRVARFTDLLFSRIEKLQEPGFDPKWKSINLGATVPGLTRFPAAQAWLDRKGNEARAKR
jgi:hypothetical protein